MISENKNRFCFWMEELIMVEPKININFCFYGRVEIIIICIKPRQSKAKQHFHVIVLTLCQRFSRKKYVLARDISTRTCTTQKGRNVYKFIYCNIIESLKRIVNQWCDQQSKLFFDHARLKASSNPNWIIVISASQAAYVTQQSWCVPGRNWLTIPPQREIN